MRIKKTKKNNNKKNKRRMKKKAVRRARKKKRRKRKRKKKRKGVRRGRTMSTRKNLKSRVLPKKAKDLLCLKILFENKKALLPIIT